MPLTPRERLIVALDFSSSDIALAFVAKMGDVLSYYKVGLELFTTAGPDIVRRLKAAGKSVFLDLKFHDIPNTVAAAAERAVASGADMFNVHTLGGMAMMRAAAEAASRSAKGMGRTPPTVLGVTVLTSLDATALETEVGLSLAGGVGEFVVAKALQAKEAGLGGVIASPQEAADIRAACGPGFRIVTPGVRPAWAGSQDQKRIATPRAAIEAGADKIVIGRPITQAADPIEAAEKILAELA